MSADIVTPKFPPSWDAWGKTCCCETITSEKMFCCSDNFYFVSKFGNSGLLLSDEQEIRDISINLDFEFYDYVCCDHYLLFALSNAYPYPFVLFYKDKEILRGSYTSYICQGDYFSLRLNISSYYTIVFYKGKKIYEGTNRVEMGNKYCGIGKNLFYEGELIYELKESVVSNFIGYYYFATLSNNNHLSLLYNGNLRR